MILIKGAKVVDGTGKHAPYPADVLINENKISAVGKFPSKKADIVINGLGLYLTPGFIDPNTDSDHHLSLFTNPIQGDFLLQGTTTIFGGLCGASLAPLLYGGLESIRKWTDVTKINVNWHTMGEFLKTLSNLKLGVNFGTFVGHSTVRRAIVGEDFRDLSDTELLKFKKVLSDSLKEGAFGLSTGLGYAHVKRTPYQELKELATLVGEAKGVYATHLRDEKEGIIPSVQETIKLTEETGVRTIISHFKPILGYERDYRKGVEFIHQAASDLDLHFDIDPFPESVVPIYTLLPAWAQMGNLAIMLSYLKNPDTKERILEELSKISGEDVRIAQAISRDYLVGKTVREFSENQGISVPEAFYKLMTLTGLRALIFYKNLDSDLILQNLERDQALIASNGASLAPTDKVLKHERFYNTFPKFIETVTGKKSLSLQQAIGKITSIPAKKFGLANRGTIAEGQIADINLFSLKSGKVKIEHVLVGGQLAVKDGKLTGVRAGQTLKHAQA